MGIVTMRSETVFSQPPETIYDFVTDPANWTKTYLGGPDIRNLRPSLFVFSSVGRLGHDSQGNGGLEGRMTIEAYNTRR